MLTLQTIGEFSQGINAAYVRQMYLLDCSQMVYTKDPVRYRNQSPPLSIGEGGLVVPIGTLLTKLDFQPQSCLFNESRTREPNGYVYDASFAAFFPRDRVEVLTWAESTRWKQYAVLWEDYNGTAYLTGTEEIGLEVSMTRSVGARNEMRLQFSAKLPLPTYYLSALNLDTLFTFYPQPPEEEGGGGTGGSGGDPGTGGGSEVVSAFSIGFSIGFS